MFKDTDLITGNLRARNNMEINGCNIKVSGSLSCIKSLPVLYERRLSNDRKASLDTLYL